MLSFNKVLMIKDGSVVAMMIEIELNRAQVVPIVLEKEFLTARTKRAACK